MGYASVGYRTTPTLPGEAIQPRRTSPSPIALPHPFFISVLEVDSREAGTDRENRSDRLNPSCPTFRCHGPARAAMRARRARASLGNAVQPMFLEQEVDGVLAQGLGRAFDLDRQHAQLLPRLRPQIDCERALAFPARRPLDNGFCFGRRRRIWRCGNGSAEQGRASG